MEYVTLSNGVKMPVLGYGTFTISNEETERCVTDAIHVGYRSIDTAQAYYNEEGVGNAVHKAIEAGTVKREELFLQQKSGLPMPGMKKQKHLLRNPYRNCRPIILTFCLFISHTMIIMVHGGQWRKHIKKVRQKQSV